MDAEDLEKDLFKNWVRGAKGLEYLQEGLQDFVGDKVELCRNQSIQKITNGWPTGSARQCNQCTSQNLLPEHANKRNTCSRSTCIEQKPNNCFGSKPKGRGKCPNGICSKLYDEIVLDHSSGDPLWKNSDPSTWCSDPLGWSFGKCFQTTISPGTSASSSDAAGLLSILINNMTIQNDWLACNDMSSKITCPFNRARDIRNAILHSSKLELDEPTLGYYLDTFITVLQDAKCLLNYNGSKQAVKKLLQLKNQQDNIRQKDVTRLMQNRKEALFELEERKAEGLREIDDRAATAISTFKKDVDNSTNVALSDIEQTKTTAILNINEEKRSALSDIKEAKREAEQDFKDNTKAALSELEQAKKGASRGVNESAKDALSKLEDAKKEAEQGVKERTKDALSELDKAKKGAAQDVEESTKDALFELEEAKKRTAQDVEESKNDALSELEEARQGASHDVKEITKAALSELEKAGKDVAQDVMESTKTAFSQLVEGGSEVKRKAANVLFLRRDREMEDESESEAREPPRKKLRTKKRMPNIKKDLKEDLIALYRHQYHLLPLSPLIEEQDTPLLKFYVMPDINSVEIQRSFGGGNEIKSKVTSLRDVFYKKNKTCREIYLTADAGFGKTAFSKRLVLTWCQAKKRIESDQKFFKEEDIQAMSEFEFVFLLSLRDCFKECDIDEMIVKQVIPRLAHTSVTVSDIETIISKGKGLVILDGLDEWIHPETICRLGPSDIPHRKARESCTILTTTRPWKLSVISLSSSQIDQKLELVGFNNTSAKDLKKNVISLLTGDNDEEKHIQDFNTTVKRKGISDLEVIPLLLMYLLCLWCDGIDLGRSKCVLYCQIVELLLKRTFKKYTALLQAREPAQGDIPQYFREHVHCKKNCTLLQALGQLAFETLFSEKRESTLVFSQSATERYLSKDDLKLCLLSGILTQSKEVKLASESYKVSFSHKTVQEYFCALYICSQNENDVKEIVKQKFNSVQNILDMSAVFVFTSGMNAEIMSSISRELMSVISEDQKTRTYRSMTNYDSRYVNPLRDIQNMYISCLKENPDNTSLCFQDFIIGGECQQENHFLNLKQLVIHNKRNIKSLSIRIQGIRCLRELIDQCELGDLHSVKKIFYRGECKEAEIIRLLTNKSLECVTVVSHTWQGNNFIPELSSCSSELSKTFQNISQLRAIYIDCFKMEHDVLKEFLNYIINRKSMAEIRLYNLHCVTHDISCGEMNLDFSQHSDLRTLGLSHIPVSQLKVNVSSLEDCTVGHLSKPGLFTSLLRELPAASKLHTFMCGYLKSSGDIETLLQTLPLLVPVKEVTLWYINLGERSLSLSPEMVNIQFVYLYEVTMSGSSLHNLVKVVEKLPHSVTVRMIDCNITPETEFADVKKYIKTSENFVVTFNGISQYDTYVFEFQTTEAGSRVH
ncbi:uncharacterized protein LOC123527516 [Mercenaria mercenaria]|uniref:uncharacterized protein LOC123527516 n=1 Tax=Mercenaria mercenaria TaxID=6596 RepID=UPI00234F427E|nr:uncharacterized protein LOC123527516 [Mercenaria mercenaria]XP_053379418.1 uncharacterized protein LOC123527516 [Mercenaria mercenaria]XP_053379419.1 uncharacterized protein LOC123527516 [Mercenaria mercenaria]XP_053379420.1 uncharacterized protein LOC123527516 [Mercenaria mercenaria]XP_053379421.1 uncharacterized protein LOC123527516 [Mercenaria mercenaria]XP_053379422.1 uncharacterized protein LOC123527516 [Mercenaria mercenaria]XP_053379423.1 uncharacterized protein LOC123527516 [Mercen